MITAFLCIFKTEDGFFVLTLPESRPQRASCFSFPDTKSSIIEDFIIEESPIVIAFFGTSSSLSKKREFASMVFSVSVTT